MVRINKQHIVKAWSIVICLLIMNLPAHADYFSRASLSKRSVLPMEPTVLSISVYTTTWFTRSADLYDLQVKNSFTIRTGRPQSSYEDINGKRYNIQTFTYQIFPLQVGKQEVPSLKISFATPEEGHYKGKEVTTTTRALAFEVMPIKQNFNGEKWMVANNIKITRSISPKQNHFKVGDVVLETITIKAQGTLASLISTVKHDTLNWATIYQGKVQRSQKVSENSVSSTVIQKFQYLIEKDGEYTIPPISLHYYDPKRKRNEIAEAKKIRWNISKNPNLTALKQLQDSLKKQNERKLVTPPKEATNKWGWFDWRYLLLGAISMIIIWRLIRLIISLKRRLFQYYQKITNSEVFLFFKILVCLKHKDIYQRINQWHFIQNNRSSSILETVQKSNRSKLIEAYDSLCAFLFDNTCTKKPSLTKLKWELYCWRRSKVKSSKEVLQINPQ